MAAMNSNILTFNYSVSSTEPTSNLSPTLPSSLISPSPLSTAIVKCPGIRSQLQTRVSDSNISIANNNGRRRRSALLSLAGVLFTVVTTTSSANAGISKANKVNQNYLILMKVLFSLSSEGRSSVAFELRMTVPDQTPEEAEAVVKSDADNLIMGVKDLAMMANLETRKEKQKTMRKSAAVLKQDLYTIIQGKPGKDRPELRRLYTVLFNGVTNLEYAARDNDVEGVQMFMDSIVRTLNEILSRIL
ncbi:psbQ-like protein 3, chloroplastic [Impatiens glandulifera]|uniref:psbQ-like protein 3, chloroplastic n=1 Tax=Impatiens glandulifera TaxID=253017 RepID=UPI001FB0D67B|nr:psbQ-like protein 3, chloroplastic [Impatiens glandulifera]